MNFLIDAQMPRRLARRLDAAGHDAAHSRIQAGESHLGLDGATGEWRTRRDFRISSIGFSYSPARSKAL
jgi:hypothetical protein